MAAEKEPVIHTEQLHTYDSGISHSSSSHDATIKDVAKLAGVTHTTVSRAIHHPEKLKAETLNRIYEAMDQLHYRPNMFARGMRHAASGMIALIVPAVSDPSCAALAQGVQDTLGRSGYQLIIASSDHNAEQERMLCRNLNDRLVDGIIIANSVNDPAPIDCFREDSNLVLIARYVESREFDGIYFNVDDGVHQIVQHLYALGHRHFALITGPSDNPESRQRLYALREELRQLKVTLEDSSICATGWTAADGWKASRKLLSKPEPPTAILALNDTLAAGAAGGAASLGLSIPEDLSLVGFYNEPGSESIIPPLTTVDAGYYKIGCSAADLLLKRMQHPTNAYVCEITPVQLIVRSSTGPAPTRLQ